MLSASEISLYGESVDLRKFINALAAIIESDTDLLLGSGALFLFLFTNKQRDKIKELYWDKTGFALWYKRLGKAKYKWPAKEKNDWKQARQSLLEQRKLAFGRQFAKRSGMLN
ncbi:hypothetical protein VIRA109638_05110 [Vibrio rarus]